MRRKIPPLQSLLCFDAAARHQSYTRAADELALTQGAVSRQIASLEAFLSTPLFRRTRHGVLLTDAGVAYARQVASRLAALERDALDAMAQPSGGGTLQIATVPTFGTRWLVPRLPDLARQCPDITIHLDTRTRPFLFADTTFDAALFAGTPEQLAQWPGTRTALLMREDVVAVASPQLLAGCKRWRAADLAQLPLLQQSTRPNAWREWFDAQGVEAPHASRGPRYELFSMLAVAASQGMGLALIPTMLIEDEFARGDLVLASSHRQVDARGIHWVVPDGRDGHPLLARFEAWLQSQAQAGAKLGSWA